MSLDANLTPTEPISPTQPSTIRRIFIGKDGLRAGWSLLIFIAIFAALAFCANRIGHKLLPPSAEAAKPGAEISPTLGFIAESIPFLITLFVT